LSITPHCSRFESSVAIDHVLGAMNYRSLPADEVRSTQVNFRRLPKPRIASKASSTDYLS
jgi:hypothetical protein